MTFVERLIELAQEIGADIKSILIRLNVLENKDVFVDKNSSESTPQNLNYQAGTHQRIKATGDFTITTSGWPPTGNTGVLLLEYVGDGTARTVTWPMINWIKSDGTITTDFVSSGVILINDDDAPNFILLWSRDAGATIFGKWIR